MSTVRFTSSRSGHFGQDTGEENSVDATKKMAAKIYVNIDELS